MHVFQKINADTPAPAEEKRLAAWGTDVPDDLVLDQKKLAEALKKENERKREEKDERKRKYNVRWNDEVTPEEMEAYRMKKIHHDDPMKDCALGVFSFGVVAMSLKKYCKTKLLNC
ncbi:Pre-mRNA-splicing factor SLU7 [Spatholobus suberectus]|nr:Pre-mRNA-splicing factor SLU7 [Spatholobus suberectus]